jgi:hypothetical protein
VNSAHNLGISAIYPLTSLSYMLLAWQRGELEDTTLSESDSDEEEYDDNGEPTVRYATEDQYMLYVPKPAPLLTSH